MDAERVEGPAPHARSEQEARSAASPSQRGEIHSPGDGNHTPQQPSERPTAKGCYLSALELHELDEACAPFLSAFGSHPYLVGSVSRRPDFRDVDVRLILADDEYDVLFAERKGLWALLSRLGSTYLRARTGLPVDFQVQRQTEANEKFGDLGETPRNPLGSRSLLDYAGGGDAAG
jgi:hypothetical protein